MSTLGRLALSLLVVAAALPVQSVGGDAKAKASVISSPEETMLLRYGPKGDSRLGAAEAFFAASADQPWWGAGSEFGRMWTEGIQWEIGKEGVARLKEELDAVPFLGPAPVYECTAKWVADTRTGQRRLHVLSVPKRLEVDDRGLLRGEKSKWQPDLWRGDYFWLLQKGKDVKELAGEYARLTGDLKAAKVSSAKVALALAAKAYGSAFEPPHVRIEQLERAVVDQPGFAKRGELIWVIRATEGRLGKFGTTWDYAAINAETAVGRSGADGKLRSLAKYLPDVENK